MKFWVINFGHDFIITINIYNILLLIKLDIYINIKIIW